MEIRVHSGPDVLDVLGARLDELHLACAAPITARRTWLTTWLGCHPRHEPLALWAENAGQLEGAVLFARRERRFASEFVALGSGLSDQVRFPARSLSAAEALASAVAQRLHAHPRPWYLTVRHLPEGDPLATRLAAELPNSELTRGDASPTLRIGAERATRAHVSKNHHQQVRRMHNRLRSEGLEPRIEHLRAPAAIAALLPAVERVCIERDAELRGVSMLDREPMRSFFPRVLLAHAERGEVELTTLHLGAELAAYVVCFLDQGSYRMWNCRLAPAFGRFGVGRIANHAALERALADPKACEFDWMRGAESYKLSMSNALVHAADLRAWSTSALRALLDGKRRLKVFVKGLVAENAWLVPAVETTRRLKFAGRKRRRAMAAAWKRVRG
jgi:CelD/BcsL family acetyltransferase involved in cellulose biosynthesis